ncbi:B12-binding domain-containing radical SAM protein [archaeon]|nr:B12-binding domain-containing radical SAM protein [Nanoarchaeota archaeon]MBU4300090.1 B12-binding domain-containing radical SAM protein [Nanoarchaeota archaeon]MBU4452292.1 B12-binding domain-containing radical SAM protein [Nanoarchaeota archaeon]MCG2723817.1 B12-binding domain-containing radical SAM protein [archaeon]
MRILCLNPGPSGSIDKKELFVKEGRCMERSGAWSNLRMPISLAYISSILKKDGHEVRLIDDIAEYSLNDKTKLDSILEKFQPDLAIINTSLPSVLTEDMFAVKKIKEKYPKAIIAMIGVAPTLITGEILKAGPVDICIRKEPEMISKEISACIASGKDWKRVLGISFVHNKAIVTNPDAPLVDINALPMPDFDSLPLDAYRTPIDRKKQVLIDVSRGCPYKCIYCTGTKFYGHDFRYRNPEKVLEEIEHVKKLGVRKILFWADTFTFNKKFVIDLCNGMVERGLEKDMSWVVNSRVNTIDQEMLKHMDEANCFLVAFGAESGNQEILNYVNKGITLEQTRNAFKWVHETNIESAAHIVFGLAPFETETTIKKTLDFVKEIKPNYANFHIATPYPGTELYARYDKEGYIINKEYTRLESPKANITLPNLSNNDLEHWRDKAFFDFYVTPRIAIQELKKVRSFPHLYNLVTNGLWFMQGWMNARKL